MCVPQWLGHQTAPQALGTKETLAIIELWHPLTCSVYSWQTICGITVGKRPSPHSLEWILASVVNASPNFPIPWYPNRLVWWWTSRVLNETSLTNAHRLCRICYKIVHHMNYRCYYAWSNIRLVFLIIIKMLVKTSCLCMAYLRNVYQWVWTLTN